MQWPSFLSKNLEGTISKKTIALVFFTSTAVLSIFYSVQKIQNYHLLEEEVASLAVQSAKASAKKQQILSYQEKYGLSNPFYLEEEVERLSLMDQEKKLLEKLVTMPFFRNHQKHLRRLDMLRSSTYKLTFAKKKRTQKLGWEEVLKAQQKSVEMSLDELIAFLKMIEEETISRPEQFFKRITIETLTPYTLRVDSEILQRRLHQPSSQRFSQS